MTDSPSRDVRAGRPQRASGSFPFAWTEPLRRRTGSREPVPGVRDDSAAPAPPEPIPEQKQQQKDPSRQTDPQSEPPGGALVSE